ncbi:serine hydrolase [Saccharicrinis sp. FJH2]|uniref:serine hydrolase n=1 Tax=Saccharicrinis sp. FJH65 TaxID=3344659 RepID=UPI0035F2C389
MKRSKIFFPLLTLIFVGYINNLYAQENLQQQTDEYINAYVEMNLFNGSVLIAKGSEILASNAYGLASYEFCIPNVAETKFRIGSLTKGFTAVAIMQLSEDHKLSLEDKLNRFIPDYPRGDEITIKNLLTHTSGIPNHTEFSDYNRDRRVYHYDVTETISTFKNKKLDFNPGEKSAYSNSNYILLGYIIEKVSTMSYEKYINENIFQPLKMLNSGFEHPDNIIKNFSGGYILQNNELHKSHYRDMSNAQASGALYSTVGDLYLWDRALYSDKIIGEKSRYLLFNEYKNNFTYGWGIVNVYKHKMIALAGETDGFRANISRFPDDDLCIIVLSNFEHTPLNRINRDLIAMVFGEKYAIPEIQKTIALPHEIMQSYEGAYEVSPGFNFNIIVEDKRCFCQPTGQSKLELFAIAENEFFIPEADAIIHFTKKDSSKTEKLILKQGGREVAAFKIN